MIRILLKLWPALTPIIIYLLWVFLIENILIKKILKKNKDLNYKVVGEGATVEPVSSYFSLRNRKFVIAIYLSLILAILSLLYLGLGNISF